MAAHGKPDAQIAKTRIPGVCKDIKAFLFNISQYSFCPSGIPLDDNNSLIERLAYKLVERQIAGKTMASALAKARQFNFKGIDTSISFLSDAPANKAKASYITNTYIQLCRQMARMRVRGSIHVPMKQLGMDIDEKAALDNAARIHEACRRYKIFCWYELQDSHTSMAPDMHKGAGVAFSGFGEAEEYIRRNKGVDSVKVMLEDKEEAKKVEKVLKKDGDGFEFVRAKTKNLVIMAPPKELIKKASKVTKKGGNLLMFEFELGESGRRMSQMVKKHGKVSVYMPFGKDWVGYAMNRIPEGRMRSWASALISKGEAGK